ncbi:MAG: SCO1664 family protein [Gordonia sp. (in: high G+C Gram-positive bacteria)]|uniref:SCO1664 family protein n=1 Tax=Gordonia sp. (in: high G+C Gram-positive bacteria) TaxID=84139 RepID=UPI0039E589CA
MTSPGAPRDVRRLLTDGALSLVGQIPSASNLTLVCDSTLDDDTARCVYKPVRGEAPLWDFPDGTLAGREVAARLIDAALGWDLIPETVLREQGPPGAELGPGMLQIWIDGPDEPAGPEPVEIFDAAEIPAGYAPILRAHDDDGSVVALAHATDERLHRLAVLDAVLNNADRKGGHILTDRDGRLYGIDHGLTLHTEPKLRTVLWGWAGAPAAAELRADLARLRTRLADDTAFRKTLRESISEAEVDALTARTAALADGRELPTPPDRRAIPWPLF